MASFSRKAGTDGIRLGSRAVWRARAGTLLVTAALVGGAAPCGAFAQSAPESRAIQLDLQAGPNAPAATPPAPATTVEPEEGFAMAATAGSLAVAGLFALLLVRSMRRRAAVRARSQALRQAASIPAEAMRREPHVPGSELVSVSVDELADVARKARIRRILVIASSAPEFVEAATLARRLAKRGTATILVDFAYSHAARDMGIVGRVEDVLTTAASPTTFADGINRDRMSSAHLMAVELGPIDGDREVVKEAAGAVLAVLGQAYEMTVVVVSSSDADCLDAMADGDTAIVVPSRIGHPTAAAQILDELAAIGVEDAVLMMIDAPEQELRAA